MSPLFPSCASVPRLILSLYAWPMSDSTPSVPCPPLALCQGSPLDRGHNVVSALTNGCALQKLLVVGWIAQGWIHGLFSLASGRPGCSGGAESRSAAVVPKQRKQKGSAASIRGASTAHLLPGNWRRWRVPHRRGPAAARVLSHLRVRSTPTTQNAAMWSCRQRPARREGDHAL